MWKKPTPSYSPQSGSDTEHCPSCFMCQGLSHNPSNLRWKLEAWRPTWCVLVWCSVIDDYNSNIITNIYWTFTMWRWCKCLTLFHVITLPSSIMLSIWEMKKHRFNHLTVLPKVIQFVSVEAGRLRYAWF